MCSHEGHEDTYATKITKVTKRQTKELRKPRRSLSCCAQGATPARLRLGWIARRPNHKPNEETVWACDWTVALSVGRRRAAPAWRLRASPVNRSFVFFVFFVSFVAKLLGSWTFAGDSPRYHAIEIKGA